MEGPGFDNISRKEAGPVAINWTKIETQYVAGSMSLKQLAKDKRVSYSTLSKKSSEGGWPKKRKDYRANVANGALARAQARGLKRMDELLKASEKLLDAATETIRDNEQFKRWVMTEGSGEGCSEAVEKVFDKRDTKAMKDMVFVLKELTGILRDAYGIQTPAQELGEKLARERIRQVQAQTAKLKRESDTEKSHGSGGVVLITETDEAPEPPEE